MEGTSKMAGLNEEGHDPQNSLAMDGHDEGISGSENYGVADDQPVASEGEDKVPERKKCHRHTPYQIQELERYYEFCPHPNEKQRIEMGKRIGLESKQVKFWFQSKRTQMKAKQERQDNALKKQEYATTQLCKTLGKPISDEVNALSRAVNARGVRNCEPTSFNFGVSNRVGASSTASRHNEYEGSLYLQVALASMEEVILLARSNSQFWMRNGDTGREEFDHSEYRKKFNPVGLKPPGFATEASRDKCLVAITSSDLVNVLMDPGLWVEMFPGFVVKAATVDVLCSGAAGTHDGELLLMTAELLFPSPFVPMRQVKFIRYCKLHPGGVWAVVDLSVEPLRDSFGDATKRCRRFPSGFIMLDRPNGISAVTCFEHAEYEENSVHRLFRPLVLSGLCFGAHRWLAALQRRCESLAFLEKSRNILPRVPSGITEEGKKSLLRLTRRVISSFCAGLCASPTLRWDKLNLGNMHPDLQIMTRVSIDEPGEISGVVVSLSTSIFLPISRQTIYNFLQDGQLRGHWVLFTNYGPMQEVIRIDKSTDPANAVSILYPSVGSSSATHMAMVQETWSDWTMSGVAYAPIDISIASAIINGRDSSFVKILPSGFVINDGYGNGPVPASLLTLGFQFSLDTIPTEKLAVNSVQTASVFMNRIIARIKAAMQCD